MGAGAGKDKIVAVDLVEKQPVRLGDDLSSEGEAALRR
jgi:hypothetical protein